jgi:outer membrane protein assembly factor BamB
MRKWIRMAFGALVFLALLVPASGQSSDWPQWRGPGGNGVSRETGWNLNALDAGPKIAWTINVGAGFSNAVVSANRLYTAGSSDKSWTVCCLDALTGKSLWTRAFDGVEEPWSTPCVAADRVFAIGRDGLVVCLRAADGSLLWQRSLKDDPAIPRQYYGWASSPVVDGDLLLIAAGYAGLALDTANGRTVWESVKQQGERPNDYGHYPTPVVCELDGVRCGLFFGPSSLSAVDLRSGERVWSWRHGEMHPLSDPVVSGTRAFVALRNTALLEMAQGVPKNTWAGSRFFSYTSTPVLLNGFLYASHGSQSFGDLAWGAYSDARMPLGCMELDSGRVMWEAPAQLHLCSLAAVAGRLLVLEVNGTLRIAEASPEAYRELASTDVLAGANRPRRFLVPPVPSGGLIYCRNYAGDLVCLDVR